MPPVGKGGHSKYAACIALFLTSDSMADITNQLQHFLLLKSDAAISDD